MTAVPHGAKNGSGGKHCSTMAQKLTRRKTWPDSLDVGGSGREHRSGGFMAQGWRRFSEHRLPDSGFTPLVFAAREVGPKLCGPASRRAWM